jgi:Tol biopolymer transport system component
MPSPQNKNKLLLTGASKVDYAGPAVSGRFGKGRSHLVFLRKRTLMAQQFDLAGFELEGDPFPVAEQVSYFSVSANGILACGSGAELSHLVLRDRRGKQLGVVGSPSVVASPNFSPDGKRLAFSRMDPVSGNWDIWVAEVDRGTPTRLTFHPNFDALPVWSPDSIQIAFSSRADGQQNIYRKASSGAGEPERMTESAYSHLVSDWSRNGQFLLFTELGSNTAEDLMILPLTGERKPAVFLKTQFAETFGRFSPDGRRIAYSSNATGAMEIYVQPFTPGSEHLGPASRSPRPGGYSHVGAAMVGNFSIYRQKAR